MPIQLIWGDDSAACDRAIESFINKIIDPTWLSLNLSKLDGSDLLQTQQALDECRTPPFGNGGRVILLKRSPICNNCPKELSEAFINIIHLIPDNTHLILSNLSKPDKRLKSTKELQSLIKENKVIEKNFSLPAVWDINGQKKFIERTAKELSIKISEDAISRLVETIGNDSSRLSSELEKLTLFSEAKVDFKTPKDNNQLITSEDIDKLISGKNTNSLQIGDVLINGNLGKTISLIDELLNKGEPALRILATLTGQVRGCLWVSLLDQEGEKDVQKISQAAGIGNPKRIYVMRKQIQGKNPKQLLTLLRQLLKIEASLKQGVFAKDAFRDGLLTDN